MFVSWINSRLSDPAVHVGRPHTGCRRDQRETSSGSFSVGGMSAHMLARIAALLRSQGLSTDNSHDAEAFMAAAQRPGHGDGSIDCGCGPVASESARPRRRRSSAHLPPSARPAPEDCGHMCTVLVIASLTTWRCDVAVNVDLRYALVRLNIDALTRVRRLVGSYGPPSAALHLFRCAPTHADDHRSAEFQLAFRCRGRQRWAAPVSNPREAKEIDVVRREPPSRYGTASRTSRYYRGASKARAAGRPAVYG